MTDSDQVVDSASGRRHPQPRIVVHDFAGHAFPVQLSRELAHRGYTIGHWHCPSVPSGKGPLARQPDDPPGLTFRELEMPSTFARYSPAKRVVQEVRYGRELGQLLRTDRPDVVIFTNTSLLAHWVAANSCARHAIPMLFWHQDIVSIAITTALRAKVGPILAWPIGRLADHLESGIAARSRAIAAISSAYLPTLERWGVAERTSVIPNWAPLPDLPVRPRDNSWAREHGLVDRPVALYSGTLGLKHNPLILVALARKMRHEMPEARVVVVSEGSGRDWLAERRQQEDLQNLLLLDYQPYASYPDVLATADVLVALLQPSAGQYSAPSKVLSYLCAARPLVAVMPNSNAASAVVRESGGGEVVQDDETAIAAVMGLLGAPESRALMGAAGRRYAEKAFDIVSKATRFEEMIWTAWTSSQAEPRAATERPALVVRGGA